MCVECALYVKLGKAQVFNKVFEVGEDGVLKGITSRAPAVNRENRLVRGPESRYKRFVDRRSFQAFPQRKHALMFAEDLDSYLLRSFTVRQVEAPAGAVGGYGRVTGASSGVEGVEGARISSGRVLTREEEWTSDEP